MIAAPDYVLVGHVTKDLVPTTEVPAGFVVGGTVTYAGLTARQLGCRVGILTSAAEDIDLAAALPGIEVVVVPAKQTTTFENTYQGSHRRQYLRAVASSIRPEHVPDSWRDAPIVHFGPLAQEFSPDLIACFRGARLRGLTPQGWLRRWDATGLVGRVDSLDLDDAFARLDVVVLSEEDVSGDWQVLDRFAEAAPLLVVTRGSEGAVLCRRGGRERLGYPAFRAREVDPTGAGDVFAAGYLIHLAETGDPVEALAFANCVASFAVEGPGTTTLPTLDQVHERWHEHDRLGRATPFLLGASGTPGPAARAGAGAES